MSADGESSPFANRKRPSDVLNGGAASGSNPNKKGRRDHGFPRGAIVLIKVSDFMTYRGSVTIQPGARLNLVLGPNGTGKSSLVCAMCIGLAGAPKVLGRGDNLKEFVRRGCRSAWTEITLSGGPGSGDFKVRRDITLTEKDNSDGSLNQNSTWKLNDRPAKLEEIKKLVADLGIQFDNLCQFLPQDKVVEFARMSPTELLAGTEKAIEDGTLHRQHGELIVLRVAIKQAELKRGGTATQLEKLRAEQGRQQRDYEKYQQKKDLEAQIALIKRKVLHLCLEGRKREVREVQHDLEDARTLYRAREEEAQADNTPIKRKEAEIKKVKAEVDRRNERMHQLNQQHAAFSGKLRDQLASADDKIDQVMNLAAESEAHRRAIDTALRTVAELAGEVQRAEGGTNPQGNTPEEVAQLTELGRLRTQLEDELAVMSAEAQELHQRDGTIASNLRMLEANMLKFTDVRQQRLRKLENKHPGITELHNWVQAHGDDFRGKVYGPILVELSNVDPQHAAALEQQLGGHLTYFVTTCREDETRLSEQIKNYRTPPANVACYDANANQPIQHPQGDARQHARYGISHTLDQVFDAPNVVKLALCNLAAINFMYIGSEETAQRMDELTSQTGVRTVYTPLGRYTFTQSRYNQQAKGNTVEGLRGVAMLSGQEDQEQGQRRELMEALRLKQEEYQRVRTDVERQSHEQQRRRESLQQVQSKIQAIKGAGKAVVTRRAQLKARYHKAQRELTTLQSRADPKAQEPVLVEARQEAVRALVQAAKDVHRVLSDQLRDGRIIVAAQLTLRELEMQKDAMECASKRAQAAVLEAEKMVRLLEAKLGAAKAEKKKAQDHMDATGPVDAATLTAFGALPQDEQELGNQLDAKEGELDGITCNMADISAYLERARRIDDGDADLAQQDQDLAIMTADLDELKGKWLPMLQEVVSGVNVTFGESLKQMGCAGEIALKEHEDFDKFAIEIKVKFRDEEELQVLTATRQSGGERSVCTILYLIALQGVANTPFRVVDEINQGMDPVNERKVFGLLMDSSLEPDTPQCFLLTPKLLPNLEFKEGLTTLNIMNGADIDADVPQRFNKEEGLYGKVYNERRHLLPPRAVVAY